MRELVSPSSQQEGIPHRARDSWDIGAISRALDHSPDPARDIAHGPGVRYSLASGALTMELFPPDAERGTGIVRLSTADSRQEFYRQPPPALRADGLIFESGEHLITLSPTGKVMTYYRVPTEGHQQLSAAPEGDGEGSDAFGGDRDATGDSGASGRSFQYALPETEGQPRVTYSGRLGTHPRTKMTPKGRFVMEFPVAVAVEGREKPEWRSTVVFDAKARQLDEVLAKGTIVDVVAYEHRKVSRDPKSGRRRERVEYYATAVTPKPRSSRGTEAPPTLPGQ
jgi:hypothetical protein